MRVPHKYTYCTKLNNSQFLVGSTLSGRIEIVNSENLRKTINAINTEDSNISLDYLQRMLLVEKKHIESNKMIGIIPTYNCNFHCYYCFENHLHKKGHEWLCKVMDIELIESIFSVVDYYLQIDHSSIKSISIFGGEPLLIENQSVLMQIFTKGHNRGLSFSITTNGSTLSEYVPFLRNYQIDQIHVTIDGPSDIHNHQRYLYPNDDSFTRILSCIHKAREFGIPIILSIRVNEKMLNRFSELLAIFFHEGFSKDSGIEIDVNGIVMKGGCTQREDFVQKNLNTAIIEANKLHNSNIFQMKLAGYSFFSRAFQRQATKPQFWHCGANTRNLIFDPFGDIYSCWYMVGDSRNRIGKLNTNIEWIEPTRSVWADRNIYTIPKCKKCKYALICGGGCAFEALLTNGSLYHPSCPDFEDSIKKWVPVLYKQIREGD